MAKQFIRLGVDLLATGGTDVRVRVSLSDTTSGFLSEKLVPAASGKITTTILNPGGDEDFALDVDETNIDHDLLLNFDVDEHRTLNDAITTTTNLWSASQIQSELDLKINAIPNPVADNRLTKTIGMDGNDLEQTGITVDDTDSVTGINDLTITGDLTVNGTTTTVNSTILEVTDANITINNGGTQASANSQQAGLTVEMSDATDAVIGFDSTTTSRFRIGDSGDLREIVTTTHNQTLTNKAINADNNTISELETDNFKIGVIDEDLNTVSAGHDTLASALAIRTYVDQEIATVDEASEITFDPSTSTLTDLNVQDAIDSLDSKVESDITNLATHVGDSSDVHGIGIGSNVVGTDTTQTLTNKTFDVNSNTLSNIDTSNLEAGVLDIDLNIVSAGHDTIPSALAVQTYVDQEVSNTLSSGDILETNFIGANNVVAFADVTAFSFTNGVTRSFESQVSVSINADTNLFEIFHIRGIQLGSDWVVDISSIGDDSLVNFDITPTGQIQYTSGMYSGFVSLDINFRADTTSI